MNAHESTADGSAIISIVPTLDALQAPPASEPAASPQFETASIRPAAESPRGIPESPDRFISPNATLADLIEFAYDLQRSQVVGGEPWTRSMRLDVEAKAAQTPTADVKRATVRSLLAQRFGLRVTRQRRELPVFVLTRSGRQLRPNLTLADETCVSRLDPQVQTPQCRTLLQAKSGPSGLLLV